MQSIAVDIMLNAIPSSGRTAKETGVRTSGITGAHASSCDPAIPPSSEVGGMNAGLRQPANGTAELQKAFNLADRGLLSPSPEKSSCSNHRGRPVINQHRVLDDSAIECIFQNSPSALLILDLVLQAKKRAGRADLAALSVSVLPVKMRVEVAIRRRSPFGHLHNFLTAIDESIKLPVLI